MKKVIISSLLLVTFFMLISEKKSENNTDIKAVSQSESLEKSKIKKLERDLEEQKTKNWKYFTKKSEFESDNLIITDEENVKEDIDSSMIQSNSNYYE